MDIVPFIKQKFAFVKNAAKTSERANQIHNARADNTLVKQKNKRQQIFNDRRGLVDKNEMQIDNCVPIQQITYNIHIVNVMPPVNYPTPSPFVNSHAPSPFANNHAPSPFVNNHAPSPFPLIPEVSPVMEQLDAPKTMTTPVNQNVPRMQDMFLNKFRDLDVNHNYGSDRVVEFVEACSKMDKTSTILICDSMGFGVKRALIAIGFSDANITSKSDITDTLSMLCSQKFHIMFVDVSHTATKAKQLFEMMILRMSTRTNALIFFGCLKRACNGFAMDDMMYHMKNAIKRNSKQDIYVMRSVGEQLLYGTYPTGRFGIQLLSINNA